MPSAEELKRQAEEQERLQKEREATAAAVSSFDAGGGVGAVVGPGAASEGGGSTPRPASYTPSGDVAGYDYESPQAIIDFLKRQQAEETVRLGRLGYEGQTIYDTQAGLADERINTILGGLLAEAGRYQDATIPGFAGGYESTAAGAAPDQQAVAGQYGALKQLQALSSPEVTAKEKFLMEQSRQAQEQDQRGYRDAVLENLAQRGALGSGGEIAALLGSQQETGQRRMLEDLGTRAGAVDRSMRAIEASGNLAGDIREGSFGEAFKRGTAADDAAAFNKDLQSQYDQWSTEQLDKQARDRWGRGLDIAATGAAAVQDSYNRGVGGINYRGNIITGSQVPGQRATTSAVVDTLNRSRAEEQAREAAEALKPKKRSVEEFLLDPVGLLKITE